MNTSYCTSQPRSSVTSTSRSSRATLPVLGLLFVCGCAGMGTTDPWSRGPAPLHVGIFLDAESLPVSLPSASGGTDGTVGYIGDEHGILFGIQEAISIENPIVTRATVLAARSRKEALAEAKGLDLLLGVGFEAPATFEGPTWPWPWATLEITTWLFGGIPSWYVPSRRFETDVRLTVAGLDLNDDQVRLWFRTDTSDLPLYTWREEVGCPEQRISLHDRSSFVDDFGDYALSIFAPPNLIALDDSMRISEAVTTKVNLDLAEQLSEVLAERFRLEEDARPIGIAFVSPDPNHIVEDDLIILDLEIRSRDRKAIRALDVLRLAPDADEFRWSASREDLAYFERVFESGSESVPFVVPVDIPLSYGQNVLKVRVVRRDGEITTRTMTYFH